jgi:hypothetical protein
MTEKTTESVIAELVFRRAITPAEGKAFMRTLNQIRCA